MGDQMVITPFDGTQLYTQVYTYAYTFSYVYTCINIYNCILYTPASLMRCKAAPICVYMRQVLRHFLDPSSCPFCFACLLRPILLTLNKIHVIYIQVYKTFKKKYICMYVYINNNSIKMTLPCPTNVWKTMIFRVKASIKIPQTCSKPTGDWKCAIRDKAAGCCDYCSWKCNTGWSARPRKAIYIYRRRKKNEKYFNWISNTRGEPLASML